MSHAQRVLRRLLGAGLGCSLSLLTCGDAGAYVRLSWNTFYGAPGATNAIDFDCNKTDGSYRLVATFLPQNVIGNLSNFGALEAEIDFRVPKNIAPFPLPPMRPPLQPFWHFESGGCNEGSIVLGINMPSGGTGILNPWGPSGFASSAFLSYAPDSPLQGVGRVLVTIIRSTPYSLTVGREYFAFTLDVTMCGAESCAGCSEEMEAVFVRAILLDPTGTEFLGLEDEATPGSDGRVCLNTGGWCGVSGPPIALSGAAATSPEPSVRNAMNGEPASARGFVKAARPGPEFLPVPARTDISPCDVVPTRAQTWGTLKMRYR
jgi:hypothetical protein